MNSDSEIDQAVLQANPHLMVILLLFVAAVIVLLSGSISLWITAAMRWFKGLPVLSVLPWKPRAWGLIDVLLVLIFAFLGQAVLIRSWADLTGTDLRKMFDEDRISLSVMAVGSASYLVAMFLGFFWLVLRYRAGTEHLGLTLKRWIPNSAVGLAAGAMSLPLVAIMSVLVSEGLKKEYKHPLIEELKHEGTVQAYLLAVFCAVIVAPLVEEFLFRVLLQGWLQSLPWSIGRWWWLVGTNQEQAGRLMSNGDMDFEPRLTEPDLPLAPVDSQLNPYEPPVLVAPVASLDVQPGMAIAIANTSAHSTTSPNPAVKPPIWPSFVAGILFGLAHFDYGLSFIPLSVLGIVLGLLYRARHSIWPCFIVHFMLNGMSMVSLGIGLLLEAAK